MRTEKFWDFISKNYDDGDGDPAERKDIAIAKKYLHRNDIVLDYACGTGTVAVEMAGLVKEIQGIDISSKMLEAAQRKADQAQIGNIRFSQATIFDERFPKAAFDVVMAFNILHLVDDIQQHLMRIHALLKPGGVFISTTPCMGENQRISYRLVFSLLYLPGVLGLGPRIKSYRVSDLEDYLTQANFYIMETEKFTDEVINDFVVAKKIGEA